MTNQAMFTAAHADARRAVALCGIPYRMAFGNALRGFQAANRGFRGTLIAPKRVWA